MSKGKSCYGRVIGGCQSTSVLQIQWDVDPSNGERKFCEYFSLVAWNPS